ncbi:MAG: DUF1064 domain-containing protein [Bacteroidales bacterium]|nr:DUF1064 domain-containing protein [Bacteroidales bacterium]
MDAKNTLHRSKFNVAGDLSKRTYKGVTYDSAMEMKYFIEVIEPMYSMGYITEYERQKKYVLQAGFKRAGKWVRPVEYVADFYIKYSNGVGEVVDVKGMPDKVALLKRKLFWGIYPDINYLWITYNKSHGGWLDYDVLQEMKRRERKKKLLSEIEALKAKEKKYGEQGK